MLIYCSTCNNLIYKSSAEVRQEGETVSKKCIRCGKEGHYFIKYSVVVDKKWDKLTNKE